MFVSMYKVGLRFATLQSCGLASFCQHSPRCEWSSFPQALAHAPGGLLAPRRFGIVLIGRGIRFVGALGMFDPYHKWLGIPKEQRPPTFYQLLGISPRETDSEVIEEAAIRQTTHLRGYQMGPHAQECTRLLNEVAQARTTLLNPGLRRDYDARLAPAATAAAPTHAADAVTAQPPRVAAPAFNKDFADFDEPRPCPRARSERTLDVRKSNTSWIIVACVGGAFLLLVVVLLFVLLRPSAAEKQVAVANPPPALPAPKPGPKPAPPVVVPQPDLNPPQPVILPKIAPGDRLPANFADAPFDAWSIQFPETICHLAMSADGSTVAAGSFHRVYVIDYAKRVWRPVLDTATHGGRAFALSPDGAVLAIGDKDSVTVWDLTTGKLLHTLPHAGADLVVCAAFSPDGAKLVTGTQSANPEHCRVRYWDVAAAKLLWTGVGHQRIVTSIAVAAGGDVISRDVDYSHRRWRAADGAEVRNVVNQRLLRENLGADGRHVVGTLQDNRTIELWDMEQNRSVRAFSTQRLAIRLRWGGDGKTAIAVDEANALAFWDVTQGKMLATRNDHAGQLVTELAIAGDGRTAVTAGMANNTVRFWNLVRLHAGQAGGAVSHDYVSETTIAKLSPRSALSERVGGEGGAPFFRFHRDAKPLLGFAGAVGNWNNRSMVRLLHPLYSREHPAPRSDETLLLAKEGYAVGGLNAVGADYCWAIQVIFCRLVGGKLDPNDSYTSPWLSEPRNDPIRRLGMNGQAALGIFGRQGLNTDALGLILALPPETPLNAAPKMILKKDDAFAGNEPLDNVFRSQHAKSYDVKLRAGQIVNIVASAGGLQMPLFVRLSSDQDLTLAADQQRTTKARLYNFCVPRDGAYRITVVNLIRGRIGPFILTVTEGAERAE